MASRKRKLTLFDVMSTQKPTGASVRGARPSALTPSPRPTDRASTSRDVLRPMSAGDELAAMRRSLSPAADRPAVSERPAVVDRPAGPPRRPIGESVGASVRSAWQRVAPPIASAARSTARTTGTAFRTGGTAAGQGVRRVGEITTRAVGRLREVDTRAVLPAVYAAAILVLLVGVFFVGRLLFGRPKSDVLANAGGVPTQTNPGVLDVGPTRTNVPASDANAAILNRPADKKLEPRNASVFGGRDLSLNYVVIEKYGSAAEAAAAVEVLAQNKVRATVEKNLPGWGKSNADQYMVVGLDGFAKVSGPEYKAYTDRLDKISAAEAGKTLPARLQYGAYKYRPAGS